MCDGDRNFQRGNGDNSGDGKTAIKALLIQWLADGMSMGSAAAFMVTGPATKITNLGALKIVLGVRHFVLYLVYVMVFSMGTGWIVNGIVMRIGQP